LDRALNPFGKEVAHGARDPGLQDRRRNGDPVEVFFPGKDRIIVAYQRGYVPIFPADGQTGDWLGTALFGPELRGMMRVLYWDNGIWEERLLVEALGSIGDVREDGVESLSHVQLGPVRVVGICKDHDVARYLVLRREDGKEELQTDGRIVAFHMQKNDAVVVDVIVVRESHYYRNRGVWVRFDWRSVKKYRLAEGGEVEIGRDTAAILKPNGEIFLAEPTKSVARLLADGGRGVGLSPDGSRLVMLLERPMGWFWWNFRLTSDPKKAIRELKAPSLGDLNNPTQTSILRISPDLRWAVFAVPLFVAVLPIPEVEI
jgi:transcriptional antiterminator Rof (Rho-off)